MSEIAAPGGHGGGSACKPRVSYKPESLGLGAMNAQVKVEQTSRTLMRNVQGHMISPRATLRTGAAA